MFACVCVHISVFLNPLNFVCFATGKVQTTSQQKGILNVVKYEQFFLD